MKLEAVSGRTRPSGGDLREVVQLAFSVCSPSAAGNELGLILSKLCALTASMGAVLADVRHSDFTQHPQVQLRHQLWTGSDAHSALPNRGERLVAENPMLAPLMRQCKRGVTRCRSEMIGEELWQRSDYVISHCQPIDANDCVMSITRGISSSDFRVLMLFRSAAASSAYGERERQILDLVHRGFDSAFSKPVETRPAVEVWLSPRSKQILQGLLEGLGEKELAQRLKLSYHTVHNYVKQLRRHYGVSSRAELLSKFITASNPLEVDPAAGMLHPTGREVGLRFNQST